MGSKVVWLFAAVGGVALVSGGCDFSVYDDNSQGCNEPCEDTADCIGGVACLDVPSGIKQCGGSNPANCVSSGGSSSGGGLRACKTSNGHICTQLVAGDVAAFSSQCKTDGISLSTCPTGYVLGCKGASATSSGESVKVDVYWYGSACGSEISKGKKCINGAQVGSGCP